MSEFEKHIGKFKKVDLSKYDNNTEKFFEEQYRKLVPHLSEEEIKDEYSRSENSGCRRDREVLEFLLFDDCYDFDIIF